MRKDWKKLFGLEKIKRHNNVLQVVFVERAVVNYSLCALKIKGVIAVKGNVVPTLKEEFLIIGMMKCWCTQPGEVVQLQSPVFLTNRLNKHFQELFWCNQMCLRAMTWARGAFSLFSHIFSNQNSSSFYSWTTPHWTGHINKVSVLVLNYTLFVVKKQYVFKTRQQWRGTKRNSLHNACATTLTLVEEL